MIRKVCRVPGCTGRSIPGLYSPRCQYHYDVQMFGKVWADRCRQQRESEERHGKNDQPLDLGRARVPS